MFSLYLSQSIVPLSSQLREKFPLHSFGLKSHVRLLVACLPRCWPIYLTCMYMGLINLVKLPQMERWVSRPHTVFWSTLVTGHFKLAYAIRGKGLVMQLPLHHTFIFFFLCSFDDIPNWRFSFLFIFYCPVLGPQDLASKARSLYSDNHSMSCSTKTYRACFKT